MEELKKQVRRAQWWLGVQRFLGALGWCLFGTLLVALGLIVVDKFRPLGVEAWVWPAGAAGLGLLAAAAWALFTGRGPIDAAIEIDRRFGLKERVSSSLAMSDQQRTSEIGVALVDDAIDRVGRIEVREHFGVSGGRQLLLPLIPAVAALLVALLVNPATQQAEGKTDLEAAKKQIETVTKSLQMGLAEQRQKAQKEGLEKAQKLLLELQRQLDQPDPKLAEDKKEKMIQLSDLKKQIEQRSRELGGAEAVQKQLEQLKDIEKGPADKLLEALSQGNFKKAKEALDKLKNDLANGKLSDKDLKDLANQIEKMQQNVEKLANAHREAVKDMEKRIAELRQEGKADEANKLEEQLMKLQAQLPQMTQLQKMADKLNKCGQCMKAGQVTEAAAALQQFEGDLKDLQQQLQEFKLMQDALEQLAQAQQQMMCPMCGGAGCKNCGKPGMGMGEGRGTGPRPLEEGDASTYDTRARTKANPGAADVVGRVEGPNEKGDASVQWSPEASSGIGQEADPLTDLRIPRKHREHSRDYFDRVRKGE